VLATTVFVSSAYGGAKENGAKGFVKGLIGGAVGGAASLIGGGLVAGAQIVRGLKNTPKAVTEKARVRRNTA
jgi:hypothetical protein